MMDSTRRGVSHIALSILFSVYPYYMLALRVCSGAKKGPSSRSRSLIRGRFERPIRVGAFIQNGDSVDEASLQLLSPFQCQESKVVLTRRAISSFERLINQSLSRTIHLFLSSDRSFALCKRTPIHPREFQCVFSHRCARTTLEDLTVGMNVLSPSRRKRVH